MKRILTLITPITLSFFFSCNTSQEPEEIKPEVKDPLFLKIEPQASGITFQNNLQESLNLNVLMYEYLYNGGGVAIGDINNDGLDDIYFSANVSGNKLYLNEGNLKFKDITDQAQVAGIPGPWNTGTVMADVNGDGLLDIYLCRSGALPPEKRKNLLFINQGSNEQGIPKFEEKGAEFGLDSNAPSTSASFFDYDLDGDLDLFLLNHNTKSIQNQNVSVTQKLMTERHEAGSQLFENQNGKFVEVTDKAGISSSMFSYGLGISTADINQDGWPDIYIGNDYSIPDFLYINQKNGTFKDELSERLGHISNFSMGNDLVDVNNDGLVDIFTLDMLPEDNERQKLLLAPDNFEMFQLNVDRGWHHQYMRNMLHVNDGTGTFSEVGQFSGISNTDWSWSALFADLDNDGLKDLFITNGYMRDYNNQDFLNYMDNYVRTSGGKLKREDLLNLVKSMPSTELNNYVYKNLGNLQFENEVKNWGFDQPSNSHGAAYSDLDLDGDLDLVINNVNAPAGVYENKSNEKSTANYLKLKLKGEKKNPFAIGTQIKVFAKGTVQYLEQNPFRGYQSSVSPTLLVGLGSILKVDSIEVFWPGGPKKSIKDISSNQTLEISPETGENLNPNANSIKSLLSEKTIINLPLAKASNDYKRQPLMLHPVSNQGKAMVSEDFNKDGKLDLFVGGEAGVSGSIYFQSANGSFSNGKSTAFTSFVNQADTDAISFDANGNGNSDLLVVTGGLYDFYPDSKAWTAHLYLNNGSGNLQEKSNAFPSFSQPASSVINLDYDQDGDQDIIIGFRQVPDQYPSSKGIQVWENDGDGNFSVSSTNQSWMEDLGMITDIISADLSGIGKSEVVIVGESTPITVLSFESGSWKNVSSTYFERPMVGLWNQVEASDWDGDGKMELLVGNLGLNTQLKASFERPMELLFKDFDNNGTIDPIFGYYIGGKKYPLASRNELIAQIPIQKKKYLDFKIYSQTPFDQLFTPEERSGASSIQINELETVYLAQDASGIYRKKNLPMEAQFFPVYSSLALDINKDGNLDMILVGNLGFGKLSLGKYDAGKGLLLLGDGNGNFETVAYQKSGIQINGDIRKTLQINDQLLFLVKDKGVYIYQ